MKNTPLQNQIQYHCDVVMDMVAGKTGLGPMQPHMDFLNQNGWGLGKTPDGQFLTIVKIKPILM